jgi:hypothetical protein
MINSSYEHDGLKEVQIKAFIRFIVERDANYKKSENTNLNNVISIMYLY